MFEGTIYCDTKCIFFLFKKKGIAFTVIELKEENAQMKKMK